MPGMRYRDDKEIHDGVGVPESQVRSVPREQKGGKVNGTSE